MTPDEIEHMKADIEAGTPGPWRAGQQGNFRVYGPDRIGEHSGLIAEVLKGRANARRIARVPQLEAEVLRLRKALGTAQGFLNPLSGYVKKGNAAKQRDLENVRDKIRAVLDGGAT